MLPLYFLSIGMSESQIALLLGTAALATLATQQFWGYLSDVALGRKRLLALMTVGSCLAALAIPQFRTFPAVAAAMFVFAAFTNPRPPLINAVILTSGGGCARHFGTFRSIGSLAFVVAAVGVSIAADWPGGPGLRVIFPAIVGGNLLFLTFLGPLPMPDGADGPGARPSLAEVLGVLLRNRIVRAFLLFILAYQLPHNFSLMMQVVLVKQLGLGAKAAVAPILLGALIEIIAFLAIRRAVARFSLMRLFLAGILAQVLRWGAIFVWPTFTVIVLTNLLHLFTFGVMYMCAVLLIDQEAPPRYRSSAQSLLNIFYMTVAMVLGPLASSLFLAHFTIRQWYGFAGIAAMASFPLWAALRRRYESERGPAAPPAGEPAT